MTAKYHAYNSSDENRLNMVWYMRLTAHLISVKVLGSTATYIALHTITQIAHAVSSKQ